MWSGIREPTPIRVRGVMNPPLLELSSKKLAEPLGGGPYVCKSIQRSSSRLLSGHTSLCYQFGPLRLKSRQFDLTHRRLTRRAGVRTTSSVRRFLQVASGNDTGGAES